MALGDEYVHSDTTSKCQVSEGQWPQCQDSLHDCHAHIVCSSGLQCQCHLKVVRRSLSRELQGQLALYVAQVPLRTKLEFKFQKDPGLESLCVASPLGENLKQVGTSLIFSPGSSLYIYISLDALGSSRQCVY